ncbi:MAG TPA: hypothetical protein VHA09_03465 [Nitrososphaera sp.]|nr:hypothetical protein [Nitrososphaera sp.]
MRGARGSIHFALEVEDSDYKELRERLGRNVIAVECKVDWMEAKSLYFRDLAGNLAEPITAGGWPVDNVNDC